MSNGNPFEKKDLETPPAGTPPVEKPPMEEPAPEKWFIPGKYKTQEEFDAHEAELEKKMSTLESTLQELKKPREPERPREPIYDPYTGQPLRQRPPTKDEMDQAFWNDPTGSVQRITMGMTAPLADTIISKMQLDRLRKEKGAGISDEVWKDISHEIRKMMAPVDPYNKAEDIGWDMAFSYQRDKHSDKIKSPETPPRGTPPTHLETPGGGGGRKGADEIDKLLTQDELDTKPWEDAGISKEEWVEWKNPFGAPPKPKGGK